MTFFESSSRSIFLFEHDLFGKPVPTFPDHALTIRPALSSTAEQTSKRDMNSNRPSEPYCVLTALSAALLEVRGSAPPHNRGCGLKKGPPVRRLRLAKQNKTPNQIRLHALWRRPFDPPASRILKSSILRPVFMAAANQRGCFPRPDHVSDGV